MTNGDVYSNHNSSSQIKSQLKKEDLDYLKSSTKMNQFAIAFPSNKKVYNPHGIFLYHIISIRLDGKHVCLCAWMENLRSAPLNPSNSPCTLASTHHYASYQTLIHMCMLVLKLGNNNSKTHLRDAYSMVGALR